MVAFGRMHRSSTDATDPHPPMPAGYVPSGGPTQSSSSRSSVVGVAPMPSIAEDEVAYRRSVSFHHPHVVWPRVPLRVPQKNPRRAVQRAQDELDARLAAAAAASEAVARDPETSSITKAIRAIPSSQSAPPAPSAGASNVAGSQSASSQITPITPSSSARRQSVTSAASTATTTPTSTTAPAPPPYVPVTNLPPVYYQPHQQHEKRLPSDTSDSAEDSQKANQSQQPSTPRSARSAHSAHSARSGRTAVGVVGGISEKAKGDGEKKLGLRDRQWFGSRRARYCKFGALILVVLAVIIGLAVGLSLGLKKKNSPKHSDSPKPSSADFPAGSYSFETTLQREETDCTSRASTWRCYPYTSGSNATFFWTIDPSPGDSDSYIVSSDTSAMTPSFSNLTTSLLDAGGDDERLVFEFDMDKEVVPDDAGTPQNRAAKCTYGGTSFKATLWTKRGGGADEAHPDDKFGAWPGDVEVTQTKSSEIGQPECEDAAGVQIADVQAAQGDCTCDYASFKL